MMVRLNIHPEGKTLFLDITRDLVFVRDFLLENFLLEITTVVCEMPLAVQFFKSLLMCEFYRV